MQVFKCNLSITYTIELKVEDATIFNSSIDSKNCVNNMCSWKMYNNNKFQTHKYTSYKLSIYRTFTILQLRTQISTTKLGKYCFTDVKVIFS